MSAASRSMPQKLGKYEVRREVGRGGMGIVYEGFDPLISRRVALKTFISEFFDGTQSDNLLTRLRREAQAAGRLSHPNIIAVYDYGEDIVKDAEGVETSTAFIAMEFVEGRSLESYCDANERFPMREIERIMSELLDALEYSHSHGVVHRDIKPANIILLADGTVKVADFGVARIESSTLTQVGTVLGSPSYMSPEQFMGQIVDGRSDLYSAGVVLYRLLTAEVPFAGGFTSVMHRVLNDNPPPPSVLNVQVPTGFDAVLRRAMAKRPDDRFQSAGEFKQAILEAKSRAPGDDAALRGDPEEMTQRRPKAAPGAAAAQKRAFPLGVLFASLGVLIALGLAAYLLWGSRLGAPPQAQLPPGGPAQPPSQSNGDYALISAVGVANPTDPAYARNSGEAERVLWLEARRQLVAKAAALYVEPGSLNANYGIVRAKLLQRSDDFIVGAVQQQPPQMTTDGRMLGMIRASVNVRDVQKSLNQISRDERIEFIRNNGDPRISVSIRAEAQRSAVAENLLKERIRSFGFVVVDEEAAKPPADFHVDGEATFKKLSATLAASGLTIEKVVLTSWTVKAVDTKTGEEIYHNTAIPEKQSWATQELALRDVGRLIGEEFTKGFFLQYFDFKPKKARLRFSGLPPNIAGAVLASVNASLVVLNASAVAQDRGDAVIDTELSGAADSASNLVQTAILAPLNRRIGAICFTLAGADAAEIHIQFDGACKSAATLNRLESAPAEALTGAPTSASVRDPRQRQGDHSASMRSIRSKARPI
jgi:predicted Ser/Thr protein kinase